MRNNKFTAIAAGLIILATGASMIPATSGWPPALDTRLYNSIADKLAAQALARLGPGGSIIVLTRDTAVFKQPAMDLLLARFQKSAVHAGAKISDVRVIQVDPLRLVEAPPGDFFELMRRTPAGSVIVSFLGPPLLLPEQLAQLGRVKPAVVALCSGGLPEQFDLRPLFTQGLLHAAVVSIRRPAKSSAVADHPGFDDLYAAVTAEDLVRLPIPAGTQKAN